MVEVQNNFTGNAAANVIVATGRTGTLAGAGGNDDIRGANGAFRLDGGSGNDKISAGVRTASSRVTLPRSSPDGVGRRVMVCLPR